MTWIKVGGTLILSLNLHRIALPSPWDVKISSWAYPWGGPGEASGPECCRLVNEKNKWVTNTGDKNSYSSGVYRELWEHIQGTVASVGVILLTAGEKEKGASSQKRKQFQGRIREHACPRVRAEFCTNYWEKSGQVRASLWILRLESDCPVGSETCRRILNRWVTWLTWCSGEVTLVVTGSKTECKEETG